MSIFDKYEVELTLQRDMLGTNPMNPNVMDVHVLDRQRKIIMEKSEINTTVDKYLKALPIAKEKGEKEVNAIIASIEEKIGYEFSDEEKEKLIAGDLAFLKENFAELDMKGTTVFFWNKELKRPMIGGHMILGFLKASGEAISRTREKKNGAFLQSKAHTHMILNQYVRVQEEFVTFDKDLKRTADGVPDYLQRSLRAETAQGPRVTLAKSEVVEAGAKLKFTLKVFTGGGKSLVTEKDFSDLFEYAELSGLGQWRNAGFGQFSVKITKLKK